MDGLGVDVDLTGVDSVGDLEAQSMVGGVDAGGETVFGGVCDLHGLIDRGKSNERKDGAKAFFSVDLHTFIDRR